MAVAAAKPGVGRDHALNRVEGDFSDWLRRRDQEEFGLRSLVDQKRREHQRRAVARLARFFRYQQKRLAHYALTIDDRAVKGSHDLPDQSPAASFKRGLPGTTPRLHPSHTLTSRCAATSVRHRSARI